MRCGSRVFQVSFRPERVLFRPCGVNLLACLCGVPMYASAQSLNFLAWTKNYSFPDRKLLVSHPEFPDGNKLTSCIVDLSLRMSKTPALTALVGP